VRNLLAVASKLPWLSVIPMPDKLLLAGLLLLASLRSYLQEGTESTLEEFLLC
jgi:hypothetical protein